MSRTLVDEMIFAPETTFAKQIAKEAGQILMKHYGNLKQVDKKGCIDFVTIADRESEEYITTRIKAEWPRHSILAEEGHNVEGDSNLWIIDPLDGTTNFSHNFPFFAVSIALYKEGKPYLGVIYDPTRDELFWAEKGKGAYLNDQPIRVTDRNSLGDCLVATGFPYDAWTSDDDNTEHLRKMLKHVVDIRRPGAAAIDLCYLAAGRIDAFWERKLKPWDMAAGVLIITEAGGKVTHFNGGDLDIYAGHIAASNGKVHKAMVDILNKG